MTTFQLTKSLFDGRNQEMKWWGDVFYVRSVYFTKRLHVDWNKKYYALGLGVAQCHKERLEPSHATRWGTLHRIVQNKSTIEKVMLLLTVAKPGWKMQFNNHKGEDTGSKRGRGERMLSTRKGEGTKDGLIFLCACRYIKLWHSLGDGERSSQEALVSGKWTCLG